MLETSRWSYPFARRVLECLQLGPVLAESRPSLFGAILVHVAGTVVNRNRLGGG